MACHACGAGIELASGERVGVRDCCERCGSDLHVCRNCAHFDPGAYNECRESSADRVLDKERANRCDYFALGTSAAPAGGEGRTRALSEAERLFKK